MDDTEIFSKSAAIRDEHECQNVAHSELSNFLGSRVHRAHGRAVYFERKIYNILGGNHLSGL